MTELVSIIDKITDSVEEGILVIDTAHNILFANRSFSNFFSSSKDSIIGKHCHEYISRDFINCHNKKEFLCICPFTSVFETGISSSINRCYINPDGIKKCFEIIASPIISDRDCINQLLVIFKDITDTKTASESIRKQQSFLSSVLDGIGDGVIVVNRDLKIISANRGYCNQVNIPENEISGRHCYEVSHNLKNPCYMEGEDCAVNKSFESGIPQISIHTHKNNSGEPLIVETKSFPIKDESGQTVSAVEVISDVTERFNLQEELQQKIKELQEFYDLAVERELKMIELKEEIDSLKKRLNAQQSGDSI